MTIKKKKEIDEIVKNMQGMTQQSILILKNAAEVLQIRDSMDKKEDSKEDSNETS